MVVKIMPDYEVKFGDVSGITTNGSYISNSTSVKIIEYKTVDENDIYANFTLAGGEYLSVKHKYGDPDETSQELSTSNFTITMPANHSEEGRTYNDSTNMEEKIFCEGNMISEGTPEAGKWVNSGNKYTFTTAQKLTYSNVKAVIFGDQYYMVEGKDDFGYTYRIYFNLQSSGTNPSATIASTNTTMKELGYFDLGVVYELLSVTKKTGASTTYDIQAQTATPEYAGSEYTLINLSGLDAWLYDSSSGESGKTYSMSYSMSDDETEKTYKLTDGTTSGKINESAEKYYNKPAFIETTISGIKLTSLDGKKLGTATQPSYNFTSDVIAKFATSDTGYFKHQNDDAKNIGRSAYGELSEEAKANLWRLPRLDGSVFGESDSAQVKLVITLKYNNEIFEVPLVVTVEREIEMSIKNEIGVVVDGEAFALADYITFKTKEEGKTATVTYLNDTLEVVVEAGYIGKFTLTKGDVTKTFEINNTTRTVPTTYFVSISSKFGMIEKDNAFTISGVENITDMYYFTNDGDDEKIIYRKRVDTSQIPSVTIETGDKNFTISEITHDVICLDHKSWLENDMYQNFTKYYIAQVEIKDASATGSEPATVAEGATTFRYRISRTYPVVGKYFSLVKNGTGIQAVINQSGWTGTSTSISMSAWLGDEEDPAYNIYKANFDDETNTIINGDNNGLGDTDYLKFEILEEESSFVGNATIDSSNNLVLTKALAANEYIVVRVSMRVSGLDRKIGTGDDSFITLGTLRLAPKNQPSST